MINISKGEKQRFKRNRLLDRAGLTLKAEKLARFRLGEPTVVQNGRRGERRSRIAGIREGHLRIGQSWIQTWIQTDE